MSSGFEEDRRSERLASRTNAPRRAKLKVGPAGRVVIPAEVRAAMGIKEGDVLLAHLAGDELRLETLDAVVRRSQALVRQSVPEGTRLVDEFLGERRGTWAEDE